MGPFKVRPRSSAVHGCDQPHPHVLVLQVFTAGTTTQTIKDGACVFRATCVKNALRCFENSSAEIVPAGEICLSEKKLHYFHDDA